MAPMAVVINPGLDRSVAVCLPFLASLRLSDAASLLSAEDGPDETCFFFLFIAGTRSASFLIGGGDRRPHLPPSLPPCGGLRPSRAEVVAHLDYASGDVVRCCCSAVDVVRFCCSAVTSLGPPARRWMSLDASARLWTSFGTLRPYRRARLSPHLPRFAPRSSHSPHRVPRSRLLPRLAPRSPHLPCLAPRSPPLLPLRVLRSSLGFPGTTWMQEILPLLLNGGDFTPVLTIPNWDRVPWLEESHAAEIADKLNAPRAFVSHMPYHLMPSSFFSSKAKVIYVSRNPKDVLVSSFHFHQMASFLHEPLTFKEFADQFLAGNIIFGKWTDHVKSWRHTDVGDRILYITYEEMIQDLHGALERMLLFLGKSLSKDALNRVSEHCEFKTMKQNKMSNYSLVPEAIMDSKKSAFLRKGKGRELADMMERRKVDILCVQETRWKGSKARSIGAGFKLFYYGVDSKRNGIGVVLKEEFVRNVLEVERVSDRVMSLKLEIEGVMLNVVSGYAPQVSCELEEKERFWSELDEVMESIPTGERVVIGADFNGHVGEGNTGDEEVMGMFGVKERNLEGQMVVDFAKRMDMAVVNTYFQKREEHRVTYKSGGRRTQVDYILCRRGNLKEISDCKVVVGESVARQHRMVVCRMTLMVWKKKRSKIEIEKKTKWWKLKKEECCEEFRQK
ncbi:hypothetical protein QTP86_013353 [Hemibagrus guttatus]|nr:hypothetical protein QTP86_013353 [Hemibagrus guttatus]